MIDILASFAIPLALSTFALAWSVRRRQLHIERLKLRIEMLEHPERFPPHHPMCGCTVR